MEDEEEGGIFLYINKFLKIDELYDNDTEKCVQHSPDKQHLHRFYDEWVSHNLWKETLKRKTKVYRLLKLLITVVSFVSRNGKRSSGWNVRFFFRLASFKREFGGKWAMTLVVEARQQLTQSLTSNYHHHPP